MAQVIISTVVVITHGTALRQGVLSRSPTKLNLIRVEENLHRVIDISDARFDPNEAQPTWRQAPRVVSPEYWL